MGTRVACGQCHDNSVTPGVDRSPGGGYGRAKVGQGGGSYGEDRWRASPAAAGGRGGAGGGRRGPRGGGGPVPPPPGGGGRRQAIAGLAGLPGAWSLVAPAAANAAAVH